MRYLLGLIFLISVFSNRGIANEWVQFTQPVPTLVSVPVTNYTTTYVPVVKQELVWVPVLQQQTVVYQWTPVYQWMPVYPVDHEPYRCWLLRRQYRY
jgi:hypothetical protein